MKNLLIGLLLLTSFSAFAHGNLEPGSYTDSSDIDDIIHGFKDNLVNRDCPGKLLDSMAHKINLSLGGKLESLQITARNIDEKKVLEIDPVYKNVPVGANGAHVRRFITNCEVK